MPSSPSIMFRQDFQELARVRLREARKLLRASEYSGAYHLAGYAVECGLKACIAKNVKRHQFPPRKTDALYTHKLEQLVEAAGLAHSLKEQQTKDNKFAENWTTTKDWSEQSRYTIFHKTFAEDLYSAITSPKHGVMKWIQQHW